MSEKDSGEKDIIPTIGELAGSLVQSGIGVFCDATEKLGEVGGKIKKGIDKVLDGRTYLPKIQKEDPFNVEKYALAINELKSNNTLEISEETREKLIDFLDFFEDSLSDGVIEQLDNIIFNGNPDFNMLFAYMAIDSEKNGEIYEQLIPILEKISI